MRCLPYCGRVLDNCAGCSHERWVSDAKISGSVTRGFFEPHLVEVNLEGKTYRGEWRTSDPSEEQKAATTYSHRKHIGQPTAAPALTFTTVDGRKIRPDDLRGKVVLVNFCATSCSICLAEMPDLIRTYRQYRPRGLEVLAVAMPYDRSDFIKEYVARHGLPFPVVWDGTGNIGRAFLDVIGTATTFVIDKQGRLISKTTGPIDFDKLRHFLKDALT